MTKASAPGKIILFGEHAVVYGRPAIAVPVFQVHAQVVISSGARNLRVGQRDFSVASLPRNDTDDVEIDAVDLRRRYFLSEARPEDPIATIIRLTCAKLGVEPRGFRVRISSTIPIGGGLGSGAAVSVAIARALGNFFATGNTESTEEGAVIARSEATKQSPNSESDADERGQARTDGTVIASDRRERSNLMSNLEIASSPNASRLLAMTNADISALVYEVEKLHHGTPSGIDNTVIAFEQPVYFVKDKPIESFRVGKPFTIAIVDTGIAAPTKIAVGDVRRAWEADKESFEKLFDHVGTLVHNARGMIERGEIEGIGGLMTANQIALATMGVSSIEIQKLVDAAMNAGALGAKLSGGGRGGNVIALVTEVTQDQVVRTLMDAGAKRVVVTVVSG